MLAGYDKTFNQADFERRLRHYFSDSAPCVIRYRLHLDTIEVMAGDQVDNVITIKLNARASEEENVRIIIQEAEKALYPSLAEIVEEPDLVDSESVIIQVSKGVSFVEAMASSSKTRVVRKEYRILRIGLNNNTIVLKQGSMRKVYHLLYIPVLKFLEFLSSGKYTPENGYDYLIKNSSVKESEAGELNGQ